MKLTPEQKEQRKQERKELKRYQTFTADVQKKLDQPRIKEMTISIEWKNSRMYGSNPHATVVIQKADGDYWRPDFVATCSGCGYDKLSTVVADCFNEFLGYKLYTYGLPVEIPYGISMADPARFKYGLNHFCGGVGIDCYYKTAEAIGGKFECVASGKTFDVYKYTEVLK